MPGNSSEKHFDSFKRISSSQCFPSTFFLSEKKGVSVPFLSTVNTMGGVVICCWLLLFFVAVVVADCLLLLADTDDVVAVAADAGAGAVVSCWCQSTYPLELVQES